LRDRELVTEAIRKAGGQKPLAAIFGVAQSAISEWGRTRPIPRHVRPRLEEYLRNIEAPTLDRNQEPDTSAQGQGGFSPPIVRLLGAAGLALKAKGIADLPRSARKRYEDRAHELLAWLRRELEEYQLMLETEHQGKPRTRQKRRKSPRP
jgi:hypothetical protein